MVRSASKVWIKKDFINADTWPTYSDAIPSGWEELAVSIPTSSSWISELAWNSNEPWALYPSKAGGNDVEPIGDYYYISDNDPFSVVLVGGSAWGGASDGALYWSSSYPLSIVYGGIGSRGLEIIL